MPGPRTYRDLTDEELEELAADFPARAPVPPLPVDAPASRMEIGPITMAGDDAWLDELIARPDAAPAPPQLSAAGPGGAFAGPDTPEARALIQQRGMSPTSPPSDDELLDPSAFDRPPTMPDVEGESWLDELIAQQGAAMDHEGAAEPPGRPVAGAPRQSRADAVLESMQAPTRMQGLAAAIGDAFFGGDRMGGVQARQRAFQTALAQARLQDIAAGERGEEREADRALTDARLGVQLRGQDLADRRAAASLTSAERRAELADQRQRELQTQRDKAAMERAQVMAQGRARNEAPALSPEQERAGLAGYLSEQANTSEAEAQAYLAGKTDGIAPGKLERLRITDSQLKTLPPAKRADVIAQGMGRAGARRDQDEPKRLEARNELLAQHAAIDEASKAWKAMSPQARQILAKVGGGDSWLASTARSAMLSDADQAHAAKLQALANALIKAQSGASVTANEWRRVATEVGLPQDPISIFNSPASIEAWLEKSKNSFRRVRDSTLSTYRDLFDDMPGETR